jgi:hypothetical protein
LTDFFRFFRSPRKAFSLPSHTTHLCAPMLRSLRRIACWKPARIVPRRRIGGLSASRVLRHGGSEGQPPASPDQVVTIQVIDRDGKQHEVKGKEGDNLLYLFHHLQVYSTNPVARRGVEPALSLRYVLNAWLKHPSGVQRQAILRRRL